MQLLQSLFSIAINTSDSTDDPNQIEYSRSKLDIAKENLKVTITKLTSSITDWAIVLIKFGSKISVLEIFHSTNSTPKDIYLLINQLKWFSGKQTGIINMSKIDKMTILKSLRRYLSKESITPRGNALDTRVKLVFLIEIREATYTKLYPQSKKLMKDFLAD